MTRHCRAALAAVLLAGLAALPLPAQTRDSTLRVAAGPQYDAGGLYRFLFGSGYRELWIRPFQVPVLDLATYAGGLTPVARTGGQQTRALRFRAPDGREFFFRSLDKDPSTVLPPDLRGTVAGSVVQDQTKSALPTAPLVVSRLLAAAGIPHAEPMIVALPDDPALGEFRPVFAGLVGTIEARVGGSGLNEHFDGALEIISSDSLMTLLDRSTHDRVDATAFLRARLFDLLIGDWDRHRDQWRWARFDSSEPRRWRPIPLDRDQAFARYDGLLLGIARQAGAPQLTNYGPEYPGMTGATWNGRDLDRRLLVGLERTDWDSVARDLRFSLRDSVIREAVRALPPEHYTIIGVTLIDWLRLRRDLLPDAARNFYRHLAGQVDVHATDGADHATVTRTRPGELDLTIRTAGDSAPWYRRHFRADETSDLRVFLGDGPDTALVTGAGDGITVRVLGEGGADLLSDSTESGKNRFYDDPAGPAKTAGIDQSVDRRLPRLPPGANPRAPPPRDWGTRWQANLWASAGPDIGLFFGGGQTFTTYGFRKFPFASRHKVRVGFATGPTAFRAEYRGEWQRENSGTRLGLLARGSGIEVIRFHGFGNEIAAPRGDEFYRVTQQQYLLSPQVLFQLAPKLSLTIGPDVKLVHTDVRRDRLLYSLDPYGDGTFGEFGAGADLVFDARNRASAATHGGRIAVGGTVRPPWWDVKETFGDVHGEATLFLSPKMPLDPTLSFRVGGRKIWGAFPYFEAAFIGDRSTVRLGRENRYAGDASAYGSSELRVQLFRTSIVVPTDVGVFGLADGGRVWLDGESSDKWHSAFGGGVWLGFLSPANTISVAVAASEERTRVYVQGGFGF
ncbi:MAG TPA: hypothetical protein VG692_04865 [Gemmatimonadales bacterium]|nr:hypothetical protein [Gemmatimonadales bacterium]